MPREANFWWFAPVASHKDWDRIRSVKLSREQAFRPPAGFVSSMCTRTRSSAQGLPSTST